MRTYGPLPRRIPKRFAITNAEGGRMLFASPTLPAAIVPVHARLRRAQIKMRSSAFATRFQVGSTNYHDGHNRQQADRRAHNPAGSAQVACVRP